MFLKISPVRSAWRASAAGALLLAWCFLSFVCPRASGKGDFSDADEKALAGYRLTPEKLDHFDAVNKKIAAAMHDDPVLKKEMNSGVLNVGSTLDDALGKFDSRAPRLAAVLKAAGMSDRDYVLSLFSVMFATSGQMMKQYTPDKPLPAYIPAENVALAEKDPARFREVVRNLDHLTAREKKSHDDDTTTDD